jgi:hypothetical protein
MHDDDGCRRQGVRLRACAPAQAAGHARSA